MANHCHCFHSYFQISYSAKKKYIYRVMLVYMESSCILYVISYLFNYLIIIIIIIIYTQLRTFSLALTFASFLLDSPSSLEELTNGESLSVFSFVGDLDVVSDSESELEEEEFLDFLCKNYRVYQLSYIYIVASYL